MRYGLGALDDAQEFLALHVPHHCCQRLVEVAAWNRGDWGTPGCCSNSVIYRLEKYVERHPASWYMLFSAPGRYSCDDKA